MSNNNLNTFFHLESLYNQGNFYELTNSEDGLYFLKLRSLARKEYLLYLLEKSKIYVDKLPAKELLKKSFEAQVSTSIIEMTIREIYTQERIERKNLERQILAELYKLRVFDWGGIHQNDINKHLVNNYIKKINNYDSLVEKIENEILNSLKGFILCSWYNNWTSIIIEDIFKDHPRVLPTIGKIKQVDFFIDQVPFDLKMTYFPIGFMEKKRKERGLTVKEVSELKKAANSLEIPFDKNRSDQDLLLDLIAAFSENSQTKVQDFYHQFISTRREIITETIQQPRNLLKWLYEQQGTQRFDASNRLFLIVIDLNHLENSWKIKRDYQLLKSEIDNYLNNQFFDLEKLKLDWSFNNQQYKSYTDVIFVVK
ncbi:MAG TPA: hypothetical protein DDZ60_15435 [Planktothrix sp. UBA10369]|jgi:hypothetical protein|nr:hypothetical protein [Planktothrix sp. UBA10369]